MDCIGTTANDQYLSIALSWVRMRLAGLAKGDRDVDLEKEYARIDSQRESVLHKLASQFELTNFERHLLLFAVAYELDPQVPMLCMRANNSQSGSYPTFGLALEMFDDPVWDALAPENPLCLWQLLSVECLPQLPLTMSPLRVSARVVNYLKGLNHLDERLARLTPAPAAVASQSLSPSQLQLVDSISGQLLQIPHTQALPLVQLIGPDPMSRRQIASVVAAKMPMPLRQLSLHQLPQNSDEIASLARLWKRETSLMTLALLIEADDWDPEHSALLTLSLVRMLENNNGLVFLARRDPWIHENKVGLLFDVNKPEPVEQKDCWLQSLRHRFVAKENTRDEHGTCRDDDNGFDHYAARLAAQFSFNFSTIEQLVALSPSADSVWQSCRDHTRPQLSQLAQRIDTRAHWDDLVLPEGPLCLLKHIAAQAALRHMVYEELGFSRKMNRGKGLKVLFAGESGTGKTMAAEVLANDLDLDLYRIDLASVVNKYVGETEKNLARLFDAAEDSGAILLFDEAEALFGKRTEIKDSRDHHVNREVDYLLQRMEAYRGLAILATNMKNDIDSAFLRRLRFVVEFPFPGVSERAELWRRAFPAEALGEAVLDYDHLARFNFCGGSIHNVAVNSAFAASRENKSIDMSIVLEMTEIEHNKMEIPVIRTLFKEPLREGGRS